MILPISAGDPKLGGKAGTGAGSPSVPPCDTTIQSSSTNAMNAKKNPKPFAEPGVRSGVSPFTFRSMTTKRKSTMIAPAYTRIWIAAMNCAWSRTNIPESERRTPTRWSAQWTALLRKTIPSAKATADREKSENRMASPMAALSRERHDDRRDREVQERRGQKNLPPEGHELVVPKTWKRRPQPNKEEEEKREFDQKPGDGRKERPAPSPEEDRDRDGGDHHHVRILRKEVEREFHRRVLGVKARHQLGFRFRQVERRAVRLGDAAEKEDHEREELRHDEPHVFLLRHDPREAQRSGHEDHAHERDPLRQLVGDHLRRGSEPSQERVLAVRGPAAEDDSVDAHRGRSQHPENRDVHVGDMQRHVAAEHRDLVPERHDAQRHKRGDDGKRGREEEDDRVRLGGDEVLLEEELDTVRDGLQESEGADPLGSDPVLHVADHFPLHPHDERNPEQYESQNDQDFDRRFDQERGVHAATSALPGVDRLVE